MTHPVKTGFGKYCGLGSRCGSDGSMSLPTPEIRGLDTEAKFILKIFCQRSDKRGRECSFLRLLQAGRLLFLGVVGS